MLEILSQVQKIIDMCGDNTEIVICNKHGIVEYSSCQYYTHLPALLLGKHILDVYPSLSEQTSTIMRTLKTGKSIVNEKQILTNNENQLITLIATSMPIFENGELIGVVDYSRFLKIVDSTLIEVERKGLYQLDDIITNNDKMLVLKEQIKIIADYNSTVLIYGETGTGKELVAQSIHTSSTRKDKPFVSQNCAAIPSNLFESIFFGTEKGSYTGAQTQKGLFEFADGGTLFLDEINSMDISMQVKLLKVLEDKKVRHIGGHKDIPFDVRIICATNEKLEDLLASKRLREDLYYRISIVKIYIPPLRQRKDDIPLLTSYFIQKYNKQMNKRIIGLSEMVKSIFDSWNWPGNVREMKNIIESSFNHAGGDEILLKDVQELTRYIEYKGSTPYDDYNNDYNDTINLQDSVDKYEKELIQYAIKNTNSLTEAANKLSITPQRLNYKITKYKLR
jgi:arginine utilization regulatory protein